MKKTIANICTICYNIEYGKEVMKIRLNFKYILKPQKINQEIIEDIMWHCAKVYNTFNYELQKGKEEIHKKRNRNIESSRIYKRYREENWHSKYLHAHTLQEVLLDVLADHKSYIALTEKYERGVSKSKENQDFQDTLVKKISYKARLEGIDVEKIKENYTSGVSSIDKEEICKANYHKERRIKRGLFRSNTGVLINADINGSINIMRKYLKNISPNLEIAMDMGLEQRPLKKRVA